MADEYINAQDLTEDTSLDGEEQFVMFDSTMGKRAKLKNIKTYMNADVAKPDGHYPELTAGNADVSAVATALAGGSYTEESVPYKFRHTGGDVTAGGAEEDCIVGGTIAWNQLYAEHTAYAFQVGDEANVSVTLNNGYINISGTPTEYTRLVFTPAQNCPANHALLLLCDGYSGFSWGRSGFPYTSRDGYIIKHSESLTVGCRIELLANTTYDIKNARFMAFDLTQMFGSIIADYIYGLEQSQAGAGVAFFRSMFPESYYEYNAGELKSVSGLSAHVTTGFNLWDEEWEVGSINFGTGEKVSNSSNIRSKNYIKALPNTTYYIKMSTSIYLFEYDSDKKFIRYNQTATVATASNTAYFLFVVGASYGTSYNHDICISLSSDRNGEYEPYKKHSYALDSSLTLRGVPQLVNNKVCYDGDEYRADGSVTRKYGVVDLGTLTWNYVNASGQERFYSSSLNGVITPPADNNGIANIVSAKYTTVAQNTLSSGSTNNVVACAYNGFVAIRDTAYTNADAFKTALSGTYLVCELTTPTTETASAYVNPQACDEYGTEEYISTSLVPVGHKTKYYDNLTKRIDKLPSMIASVERSSTASTNYAVGSYLILNNTLYKVTSAISAGGTITAGSNVTATTIMAEIKALQ